MLDRLFGGCDGFFGTGWWIIILFFLFLAFGDTWVCLLYTSDAADEL